jgi:hypothetical protein
MLRTLTDPWWVLLQARMNPSQKAAARAALERRVTLWQVLSHPTSSPSLYIVGVSVGSGASPPREDGLAHPVDG